MERDERHGEEAMRVERAVFEYGLWLRADKELGEWEERERFKAEGLPEWGIWLK